MKVITIGRSNDNNIVVNDPTVGRHHVQIILHDDGRIGIVDLSSKNGTYVNGKRINCEVPLKRGDKVQLGMSLFPWERYFSAKLSPRRKNDNTLAIVLGSVGGALMLIIAIVLFLHLHKSPDLPSAFQFEGEYPPVVEMQMTDSDGTPYTIDAIEGHVCVWFKEGTAYKTAEECIKQLGGKIVAQIPQHGYYLVEVSSNEVQSFIRNMTANPSVERAYPNMVYYSCTAHNYILDNYYPKENDPVSHGGKVEFALSECGTKSSLTTFNIGANNGKKMCTGQQLVYQDYMCDNSELFALDSIARLPYEGPIVINMSYGVSLPKRLDKQQKEIKYYWPDAKKEEKESYQFWYTQSIKEKIRHLAPLKDKDFIVVVAAGNEGVKVYDDSILSYMKGWKGLSSAEQKFVDDHFIFVTAGEESRAEKYRKEYEEWKEIYEQKKQWADPDAAYSKKKMVAAYDDYESFVRYSNEVPAGHYDSWATKVDISDFKYNGKDTRGTSFAAPRATCMLSSAINETNLTGKQVLDVARAVTKRDGELTHDALLKEAKKYAESLRPKPQSAQPQQPPTKKVAKPQPKSTPTIKSQSFYVKLNEDVTFTLDDGSQGTLSLYTFGLGDLTFKMYWSGDNPIDVHWRLDGYGLTPSSGDISSKHKYCYVISNVEFFDWTGSEANARGIEVYVTPRR